MAEIIQIGNPILRQIALPIEQIEGAKTQNLIEQLILAVREANGVGIAAPQIGDSCRLFIVASRPNPRYPSAPVMEPTPVINPKIIAHSDEIVRGWEGCLSVSGQRGLVPRYQKIMVEFYTRDGQLQRREFTDFIARIIQHELDHLDGILFVDRILDPQDIYSEEEYWRIINEKY